MSGPVATLNMTVAQIEDELRAGKTVQEIAREWSEPISNVLAVRQAMNGGNARPDLTVARQPSTTSQTGLSGSATRPVPAPPTPAPPVAGSAEPTLDELVNAAARSTSKRTQALGAKLGELAGVVRQRLREERNTAELKAREAEIREKATAEVAELERKLAAARAKLKKPITDAQRNARKASVVKATAAARTAAHGEFPCDNGCGKVATTKAGQRAHERHCKAVAS